MNIIIQKQLGEKQRWYKYIQRITIVTQVELIKVRDVRDKKRKRNPQ